MRLLVALWLWSVPLLAADNQNADSGPLEGVPQGEVTRYTWQSQIFPGTVRDYWTYVPRQYTGEKPACVMIFQDGGGYVSTNGSYRVPTVFDELIFKKEMPITIGIFINPGVLPPLSSNALPRYNRSFEYDALGDRYARFLLEEILPEVSKKYRLETNATSRALAGASSGAIAAFTAAWERPEEFGRVFSTIGTYVGLRGGNVYPTLIRKSEPKPIKVFLQDGSNDNNGYGGDWWLANQEMLSALRWAGYAVTNAWGDGGHDSKHGGAIFPEAVRWLWKDYPELKAGFSQRAPIADILLPREEWELVAKGYKFTEGPAVNEKGEVFFTDIPNNRIHKIALDGKVATFAEGSGAANGLAFDAAGNLWACANAKKQILKYTPDGKVSIALNDVESNDIVVAHNGHFYFTDPNNKRVWHGTPAGKGTAEDTGITRPNGITLAPDQSLLMVSDTAGQMVYSFQILADGSLTNKQPFYHLHLPDTATQSGADGMTVDSEGRLYVTTMAGLQVCDQAGRVNAIISKPQRAWLSNVAFGGPEMDTLFVTCGDKIYKRKTRTKGVASYRPPFRPPPPRL